MVKDTQRIRRPLSTNCLSVFDHFVGLAFKSLAIEKQNYQLVKYPQNACTSSKSYIKVLPKSAKRYLIMFKGNYKDAETASKYPTDVVLL